MISTELIIILGEHVMSQVMRHKFIYCMILQILVKSTRAKKNHKIIMFMVSFGMMWGYVAMILHLGSLIYARQV